MFTCAGKFGDNIDVQLSYFRGDEFIVSPWHTQSASLASMMSLVMCRAGSTQIGNVFRNALQQHSIKKVDALIFVGDSCEEDGIGLVRLAADLSRNGIRLFMFHDDTPMKEPVNRNPQTREIFEAIVAAANGAFAQFDTRSSDTLQDYLKAVVAFTTKDTRKLDSLVTGGQIKTEAGRRLIASVRGFLPPPSPK
jgi:hypothetical protein